ncbi:MAG: DUF92 domain-containing protein [Candidatus Methanoplasma sp.]|jgi:uncharacterized protein (TIGR00297 family)|nr:DUF92 domain-containing protein [Candidatus Methanoplasma sp.]
MDFLAQMAAALVLSALLSVVAYKMRMLTLGGAVASMFVGYIVGLFGSFEWLVVLILFTAVGLVATRMNIGEKIASGLQEGTAGERTYKNVLGVGLPPCTVAVAYMLINRFIGNEYDLELTVAFLSTLAVAAADTLASEVGVKDGRVWLITNLRRVKRGTNGGISPLGTGAAFAGSLVTAVIGWLIIYKELDLAMGVPILMGLAGCFLDSLLGATLESHGVISKYTNNCVTAIAGAGLGFLAVFLIW